MIDVGGQRSERRKWLHCFQSVNAVIFMVALNEYDMVLEEDGQTNRLNESLKLFQLLTGTKWLRDKPCIVFLNKSDLFREEIKSCPLEEYFADYEEFVKDLKKADEMDKYEIGAEFMKSLFVKKFQGTVMYAYVTCAVDKENCETVFKIVRREIIETAFNLSGL